MKANSARVSNCNNYQFNHFKPYYKQIFKQVNFRRESGSECTYTMPFIATQLKWSTLCHNLHTRAMFVCGNKTRNFSIFGIRANSVSFRFVKLPLIVLRVTTSHHVLPVQS